VKLAKTARAAVPGEDVVAAGIFQAGGSLTARMSGWGEFSVRRREREERASSGLPFKRHLLLVVTPARLHMFDAKSVVTGWRAGRALASWDRSAIGATADPKSVTIRLTLQVPSENRRIELEAPKARRATSGEVARLLVSGTVPPRVDVAPSMGGHLSSPGPQESVRLHRLRNAAGWGAVVAGVARLGAYGLPWVVVTPPPGSGYPIGISGFRALGSPVLSIGYSIAIAGAGFFYLAGRREASPRLLQGLGVGSIIVFLFQFQSTLSGMGPLRTALHARGVVAMVSIGFGVWVELAGAILTLAAGIYAVKLSKEANQPGGTYVPPP
jgi:hypothetical protein